jgi:hypothetical protein
MAGTTQIVVQWPFGGNGLSAAQMSELQGILDEREAKSGFDSDGNDVGGGLVNFYLYADDSRVNAVVRDVIALRTQSLVPGGMRIGVASYKNAERTDWDYRPVYPATLKHFDIAKDVGN